MLNWPKITIRATQSVMMSRAVDRTLVGSIREFGCLLGPAQGRVRPQGRAEPGVEDVGILGQNAAGCPSSSGACLGSSDPRADQPATGFGLTPDRVRIAVTSGRRTESRLQVCAGLADTRPGSDAPTRAAG